MARAALAAAAADSEWLDLMVKDLKEELQRQLARVREADEGKYDPRARASDARTLAALENTLQKLTKLEQQRMAVRESKVARHDDGARAALERRLDKLVDQAGAPGLAREPER